MDGRQESMKPKTIAKLRDWMRKYGHIGTLLAGCWLVWHALRTRRVAWFLAATVLTVLGTLLVCMLPYRRTKPAVPPAIRLPVQPPVINEIVSSTDDINARLLDAVRAKDLARVQAALAAGAQVDSADGKGYTALMLAAERRQETTVRLLLRHGADAEEALRLAFYHRNAIMIRLLLKHVSSDTVPRLVRDDPDLVADAAKSGDNEILRLLFTHGAPLRGEYSEDLSLIALAADQNHPSTVDLLLSFGADPDEENAREGSALYQVAEQGDLAMVRFLVARGADVNYRSQHASVLQIAVAHSEIVRFLLNHGAKVDLRGKGGVTPLLDAAYEGDTESVRVLLSHGADADHQSEHGETALNLAAGEGHVAVVKTLLQWGVHVNAVGKNPDTGESYETALQAAEANQHAEIVRLLKRAGATR